MVKCAHVKEMNECRNSYSLGLAQNFDLAETRSRTDLALGHRLLIRVHENWLCFLSGSFSGYFL